MYIISRLLGCIALAMEVYCILPCPTLSQARYMITLQPEDPLKGQVISYVLFYLLLKSEFKWTNFWAIVNSSTWIIKLYQLTACVNKMNIWMQHTPEQAQPLNLFSYYKTYWTNTAIDIHLYHGL